MHKLIQKTSQSKIYKIVFFLITISAFMLEWFSKCFINSLCITILNLIHKAYIAGFFTATIAAFSGALGVFILNIYRTIRQEKLKNIAPLKEARHLITEISLFNNQLKDFISKYYERKETWVPLQLGCECR